MAPPATALEPAADDAPLVGRLQMQDRMVDLTVNAFADTPDGIPTSSYARVIADVDVDAVRREQAEPRPRRIAPPEDGDNEPRLLRR